MKLEILFIALLCTVKATGKVNGELLKIEEGGSGTENDALIKHIKKINGGSKQQIVTDTESSGVGEIESTDFDDSSSGSGESEDGSGSGIEPDPPLRVISTSSPTFEISTGVKNVTSQTVIVINPGGTVAAVTTTRKEAVTTTHKETVTDKMHTNEITEPNNSVEDTRISSEDDDTNKIDREKSTALDEDDNDSGINFTIAIVVGVVVGAILSILIIIFLVYRLRKKDEGSYSLDEPSAAMLTADTDSPPPKGKGNYYA